MAVSICCRFSRSIFSGVSAREKSLSAAGPVVVSFVLNERIHDTSTLNGSPSRCDIIVTAGVSHAWTASSSEAITASISKLTLSPYLLIHKELQ
jgi:hypothetical protein